MRFDYALGHWNREEVALISEELEARREITIIDNIQKTIGVLLGLHFSKMNRFWG